MAYLHKEIYLFEGDTIIWTQLCKKYSTQLLKVVFYTTVKKENTKHYFKPIFIPVFIFL